MPADRLQPRILGRTGQQIAPVIWQAAEHAIVSPAAAELLLDCAEAGANWILVPAGLATDLVARLGDLLRHVHANWELIIGVGADELHIDEEFLSQRLTALGTSRCDTVMLENASAEAIKSGRPFHRMMRLRDHGILRHFAIAAERCADAEWFVNHTPAHAVSVPFGWLDQTAKYRVLSAAADLGVAIFAAPVAEAQWSPPEALGQQSQLSFVAAEPLVTAVLQRLPDTEPALDRVLSAINKPMPVEQHARWWGVYLQQVPEPAKPSRNLPPDMA